MTFTTVKQGAILYRAAITVEEKPTPRVCSDTGKIGVYFSAYTPYLAETMSVEYNRKLYVAMYRVERDIHVIEGKYSFQKLYDYDWESGWRELELPHICQVSHIDYEITAIDDNLCEREPTAAELFLTKKDLSKIHYMTSYEITPELAKRYWKRRDDEYIRSI